jgi:hypothetical protein
MATKAGWFMGASALLLGFACGDSGDEVFTDASSSGSSAGGAGAGVGSGSGTGGSIGPSCEPPCDSGTFCSVTASCIADGSCAADGDCGAGLVCDTATSVCVPGGGCGAMEVALTAVPPNLMIVLDRSCSMRRDLANNINIAGPNKWTYSVDAINKMTTDYVGQIRFGLILFPDTVTPQCQQDVPAAAVGDGNESAIQTLLTAALDTTDANYPDGPCVTNIDTAMEQAALEPAFSDMGRDSYALLITDGKQAGCNAAGGDNGTTQILTDMAAAGVPTFVVGFGGGVDPAQLDIFAVAGGVPQAGMPSYYQADNPMQLEQALDTIASATLGCVFALESTPPDDNAIFVFFDNDPNAVPRDTTHAAGWDYDATNNQVEFFGATCDDIKAGNVSDVDIVFGCQEPTPD